MKISSVDQLFVFSFPGFLDSLDMNGINDKDDIHLSVNHKLKYQSQMSAELSWVLPLVHVIDDQKMKETKDASVRLDTRAW